MLACSTSYRCPCRFRCCIQWPGARIRAVCACRNPAGFMNLGRARQDPAITMDPCGIRISAPTAGLGSCATMMKSRSSNGRTSFCMSSSARSPTIWVSTGSRWPATSKCGLMNSRSCWTAPTLARRKLSKRLASSNRVDCSAIVFNSLPCGWGSTNFIGIGCWWHLCRPKPGNLF